MPHMSADDRLRELLERQQNADPLRGIRQAEGETVKATLAPHFKVHHDGDGLDRFGPAPMEDKRVYGRMMGRALMMAGVAACIAIGLLAALQAYFPGGFS